MPELIPRLHRIRRAFHAQMFLARLAETALAVSSAWLVWIGLSALAGFAVWNLWLALSAVALALITAGVWTHAQRLSINASALQIDRLAQTHDRFTTALALQSPRGEVEASAAAECAVFLNHFDEKPWTRLRLSRRFATLVVPIIATAMLAWLRQPLPPSAEELAKRDAAQTRAHALEQLAEQVQKLDTPEAKRIAEQMQQSVKQIVSAKTGDEAGKVALRAISEAEAGLRNSVLAAQQAQFDALAKALATTPQTGKAAQDLQQRKLAEAAQALAGAAQKMDAATAEKIAEAMKRALSQIAQSSSDSALAQQMGQLASAKNSTGTSSAQQALQRLAQMLAQQSGEQAAHDFSSQNSGNSPAAQQIMNLLENLKQSSDAGERSVASLGKPGGNEKPGNGSQPRMSDSGKGSQPGPMMLGMMPSGQPGGEPDPGTTKTLYGEKNDAGKPVAATQLQGVLGQGESLQTLVQSAGGRGEAARRYREIYDATVPAAEQTVDEEAIPAGSRIIVKRYFESIRPPE